MTASPGRVLDLCAIDSKHGVLELTRSWLAFVEWMPAAAERELPYGATFSSIHR